MGRDPNMPPAIFDGYLDVDMSTNALAVHADDFGASKIMYQRSDGPQQVVEDLSDGGNVSME
jgi:hypothetical protein